MEYRPDDQQRRQQLLNIVERGNAEQLFAFLQRYHRRPFRNIAEVMMYDGVIDDQIDFIDCTGTRYNVTPLIIAAGKGSVEKTKILLVHGANPNKQCATGDTALNLAAYRQKYHIVDLLLQYKANPNIPNQAGKSALHRAVVSYNDENANQIRAILRAGGDPTLEDRNRRTPFDEAVVANKPEILTALITHDRALINRAQRAAFVAARAGNDETLKVLLAAGMDPNIADRSRMAPLHFAVRSGKLSTARLLISYGADPNMANNRGETPAGWSRYLEPEKRQSFLNVFSTTETNDLRMRRLSYSQNLPSLAPMIDTKLLSESVSTVIEDTPKISSEQRRDANIDLTVNPIPYMHPLLRSHRNWTLDSDEFRSRTDPNSSVQNLLDASSGTFWRCLLNKDAFVIFDFKHQYNISGIRIIGSDSQSTPRNIHIDVSNALNGPWLRVKDFTCSMNRTTNDLFFTPLKTRFIRIFINDNYGGDDIRVQGVGFYGVDMRLVNILREFGLERSLPTLLSNDVNDLEALDEKRDDILNSSDRYLDVNDHFQFIRLTEALKVPKLTQLQWFNPPQTTVTAGEKLQTFSAAGDEGVTDRVKLEEKMETSTFIRTILLRDLEPIQGRSLVDFPDYVIHDPGRYRVRVVSIESPNIQTPWYDITVGPKPPTISTQTSDGPLRPQPPFPRVSPSTSPTDIDEEFGRSAVFDSKKPILKTPIPSSNGHGPRVDMDDDSDTEHNIGTKFVPGKKSNIVPKNRLVDSVTQSEEKSTRTIGTMHEPVQTKNFGNEVQPISSATQTTTPAKEEHPEPPKMRPESPVPPRKRSKSPEPQIKSQRQYSYPPFDEDREPAYSNTFPRDHIREERKPRVIEYDEDPEYDDYFCYSVNPNVTPRGRPIYQSPCRISYSSDFDDRYHGRFIPTYRTLQPTARIYRPQTPTPHSVRYVSPPRYRPPSAPPMTQRRRMRSQETDTSMDSMFGRKDAGIQYDAPSRRDRGTTPSLRSRPPPGLGRPVLVPKQVPRQISPTGRPVMYQDVPIRYNYPTAQEIPYVSPHDRDRSRSPYYYLNQGKQSLRVKPVDRPYYRNVVDASDQYDQEEPSYLRDLNLSSQYQDIYDDDYEEHRIPAMHDRSTMADLIVSFDHYTQYDPQTFMADRHIQTTPMLDEFEEHERSVQLPDEIDVQQLPANISTSLTQPSVIQPPTLPRPRRTDRSPAHLKRDGIDYTGAVLELPVHHARQDRLTSTRQSPLLNIGTEHIIRQSPANEFATPFETYYIYESDGSSTYSRSHHRNSRHDSWHQSGANPSRNQLFQRETTDHSPVRQSRSNGNFYLSSPPLRSINSSFRLDITREE